MFPLFNLLKSMRFCLPSLNLPGESRSEISKLDEKRDLEKFSASGFLKGLKSQFEKAQKQQGKRMLR